MGRQPVAEETARVSNGNIGLEIFAVTNLIIIVDLGSAISSPRTGDSEQRTSNSVDESLVTHERTQLCGKLRDDCNFEITQTEVISPLI